MNIVVLIIRVKVSNVGTAEEWMITLDEKEDDVVYKNMACGLYS